MLVLARHIAEELLAKQIEHGYALIERASLVGDFSDYESWKADRRQWVTATAESVASIFASSEETEEFTRAASAPTDGQRWQAEYAGDVECVRGAVDVLVSLQARVESAGDGDDGGGDDPGEHAPAAPRPEGVQSPQWSPAKIDAARRPAKGSVSRLPTAVPSPPDRLTDEPRIFIVHGRDRKRADGVVRLLETAGSHAVTVLDDQPHDGRSLVERFQGLTAKSGYAIVVLTADDVGTPRLHPDEEPFFSPRARQGVVFQMGYLMGLLTPRRVCVLHEHGVELPSDLAGLVYVQFDLAGAWESKLLLELKGAGFEYDAAQAAAAQRR